MLSNYTLIFSLLFLFYEFTANAGDIKTKVTWGPEYFAPKKHQPLAFLGNLQKGFVHISHQRGKSLCIQLFNPNLSLKSEKYIDIKALPKDHDMQDCIEWGGRYYLFFSTWTKSEAKERFYGQELDIEKGTFKGSAKELIACNQVSGTGTFYGFYQFRTTNKFPIVFGSDSSTIGVYVQYRPQDKKDYDKNSEYGFWAFDKDLKAVWSQPKVSMPYAPKKMDLEDYARDREGNFLFLTTVYDNESGKRIIDNAPAFHFEILKFTKGSKTPTKIPFTFTDKYVSQIAMFEDLQGRLVCAGYYGVRDKKGKMKANGSNVDGAFILRLNDAGDGFENIYKGTYELPTEVLKQFESTSTQKKLDKKEEAGEDPTQQNLKLRKIIFHDNGSIAIIGEESYSVTVQYYNPSTKSWTTRTTYYRNDIFVQLIGNNGELVWTKKIPKAQNGGSPTGFSFRVTAYNGDYYFLFMDNAKNTSLSTSTAPASFNGGYNGVLSTVKVGADGQMSKAILFDTKKLDQLITLEQGDWLNDNTFVISSVMGTNGPNDRNKLCLIKFTE